MPLLAAICEELGLAGPKRTAVNKSTDKAEMCRAFAMHGVCRLPFCEVANEFQAIDAVRSFDFPTIFKPVLSSGGRGICRVSTEATHEEIAAGFKQAAAYSSNGCVIIEKLVGGAEYSVEIIVASGQIHVVAVTEKTTTGPPYYVEVGHRQPAALSRIAFDNLSHFAAGAVEACGIDNAPAHAEIRLTDDGPVIMEVAARLGGGFISSHLTPLSTGIDLLRATIDVSLGRTPDLVGEGHAGAAVAFLRPQPGRIVSITGLAAARNDPFCVDAQIYKRTGECIEPLRNATGRVGHVVACGSTAEDASATAARIIGLIKIQMEHG